MEPTDIFRVKIGRKRQVTMPQLMLETLHLREGDELEFLLAEDEIMAVRPLKLVPVKLSIKKDILRQIERRDTEARDIGADSPAEGTGWKEVRKETIRKDAQRPGAKSAD